MPKNNNQSKELTVMKSNKIFPIQKIFSLSYEKFLSMKSIFANVGAYVPEVASKPSAQKPTSYFGVIFF